MTRHAARAGEWEARQAAAASADAQPVEDCSGCGVSLVGSVVAGSGYCSGCIRGWYGDEREGEMTEPWWRQGVLMLEEAA